MGEPKPALAYGTTTLIGAVICKAREAGLDPVVVVTGFHADAVAGAVGDAAAITHNPDPGRGNMSSLLVGAAAVKDAHAMIVLLSDMPAVETTVISALCLWLSESKAVCAWTRYSDGRGHPVAFTPKGIESIRGLSGTKALWPYFDSLADDERYELVVDGPRPSDINTPADYDESVARRTAGSRKWKPGDVPP